MLARSLAWTSTVLMSSRPHKDWPFCILTTYQVLEVFHEPSFASQSTSFMLPNEPRCSVIPVMSVVNAAAWQYKLGNWTYQESISWQGLVQQRRESRMKGCSPSNLY